MTCEEVRNQLAGLVGDEPETGRDAEAALAHLRECPGCARRFQRFQFHFQNLRSLKYTPGAEGDMLEGFAESVRKEVKRRKRHGTETPARAELPEPRKVSERVIRVRKSAIERFNWGLAFRITATAALVVFVVTLFAIHIGRHRQPISPEMAEINAPDIHPPIIEDWTPARTGNLEVIFGGTDETTDWALMPVETGPTLNRGKSLKRSQIKDIPVDDVACRILDCVRQARLTVEESKPKSRQARAYSVDTLLEF